MLLRIGFLCFVICFLLPYKTIFSESIPTKIRVGILSKYTPKEIEIRFWDAKVIAGKRFIEKKNSTLRLKANANRIVVHHESKNFSEEFIGFLGGSYEISFPIRKDVFRYSGDLEITSIKGKLVLILSIPKNEYTRIATESEFGTLFHTNPQNITAPNWKKEFKSAAETVVLSYALANLNRHKSEGYDLCDLTHCLQYSGRTDRKSKVQEEDSSLFILKDSNGNILEAFFHSACGGNLTRPSVMWKNHKSQENMFRSGKDLWKTNRILCKTSPHFRWENVIHRIDLEKALELKKITQLQTIQKESRVTEVLVKTENGNSSIPVALFLSKIGKGLGWNQIKSNDFNIENSRNGFLIQGKGFGHGVGLCQYGAREMAFQGATSAEILKFYFPNARLAKL